MPRDSTGAYQDVAGNNPVVSGSVISSVIHNNAATDYAQTFTNSLDRTGKGGMLAALSMGGHPINGLTPGVASTDAATVGQLGTISRSVRAATLGGADTATLSDAVIYWNYSASGTSKTQTIPAASTAAPGQTLVIKDRLGDAAIKPIVITPTGGTIDDRGSVSLNVGKASLNLVADPTNNNWMLT